MPNRITAFLKKKDLYLGIVRYIIGLTMITYAITKILRTQFVVLPFAMWQRPLESVSGTTLAWAFLGHSPWFQVMLGFLELIPALLVLFRRTTLLGAILLLPVSLNVFLINQALNLWADTKTISLILLLLNLTVFAFEWQRVKHIALTIFGYGKKFKYSVIEIGINIVAIALVAFFFSNLLLKYMNETNVLTGDWYHQRPLEWTLQSEKWNDSTLAPRKLKIFFGAYNSFTQLNDTGFVRHEYASYKLNEKQHQISFYDESEKLQNTSDYTFTGDSLLRLETVADKSAKGKLMRVFKKRIIHAGGW